MYTRCGTSLIELGLRLSYNRLLIPTMGQHPPIPLEVTGTWGEASSTRSVSGAQYSMLPMLHYSPSLERSAVGVGCKFTVILGLAGT